MRRLLVLSALCIFAIKPTDQLYGQHSSYDYFIDNNSATHGGEVVGFDDSFLSNILFYAPSASGSETFRELSDFKFTSVRYSHRGYDRRHEGIYFGDLTLSENFGGYANYPLRQAISSSGFSKQQNGANSYNYSPDLTKASTRGMVRLYGTNRKGRGGVRASANGSPAEGLHLLANINARWGREATVDGGFIEEYSALLSGQYGFGQGDNHTISAYLIGAWQERGMRSYATQEAFDLTDDNLYNPSWGYWGGKQRNSRVAGDFRPTAILNYGGVLSKRTTLSVSMSYSFGESNYSTLAWFDAETPYPDYYRYMPSYTGDPADELLWRERNPDVVQLNWRGMREANQWSDQTAYISESRVESVSDFQGVVSATTSLGMATKIKYGVRYRLSNREHFKRMKDLLGGAPIADIDQYLLDDEVFGDKTLNDLRNPYRRIAKGDKFGYDFTIAAEEYSAFANLSHDGVRYRLSASFELGESTIQRRGHYEKEQFPGNGSYGNSKKLKFTRFAADVKFAYSISPRHRLTASGAISQSPAQYNEIFISPRYSNSTIESPKELRHYSADLSYVMTLPLFRFTLSAYYTATQNQSAVTSYYDDIASVFSNMVQAGIDKSYLGVEFSGEYNITPHLTLRVIAAYGDNRFDKSAEIEIMEDATQQSYVVGAKSYLKGYNIGGSPQGVVATELSYYNRGWIASLRYSYMYDRYLTPSPLRRMGRAYPDRDAEPELFREYTDQERLANVGNLNIFLMKMFSIKSCQMSIFGSIDNLLNDKAIIYGGYEQMRLVKQGRDATQSVRPAPSKYLYGQGINYYIAFNIYF